MSVGLSIIDYRLLNLKTLHCYPLVDHGEQPICKLALNDKAVFQHCLILQVLDTGDLVVFCISASTSGASPPDACFSPYLPMRSSETRATALLLMKPIS